MATVDDGVTGESDGDEGVGLHHIREVVSDLEKMACDAGVNACWRGGGKCCGINRSFNIC
jgi:hypothetical protein